ncbi:hypothetical protein [Streptomyces sp. NPDC047981]|uniref:hypothetical protein n=1 Tax=Streptomyces sp. NPDC047981 TaxID=3154610 RepID=UPI003416E413
MRSLVQGQTGAGKAAVDDLWSVLQHLELVLDGPDDLVEVGCGEVADVALDQRPDASSGSSLVSSWEAGRQ